MRGHLVLVALLLTPGCARSTEGAPSGGDAKPEAPPPATMEPSYELVHSICEHPCGGDTATLTVFSDAQGKVGRIRFDGSPESCSHPPRIYYAPDGSESLAIPMEPITPGSDRAKELARDQAAQTGGLPNEELLGCPRPDACDAKRTEGFASTYPCRTDSDCRECQCEPVDRKTFDARGSDACYLDGAECMATNPACCGGVCMLSR